MSASLASMGFTASQNMLEGELGLLDVLTETPDQTIMLDQLGQKFHINRLSIKPYPT